MSTRTAPRSLLLIGYFIFFCIGIPNGILNVSWTYMQVTFGVSLDSLGVLLVAATLGSLLGTFFSGRVINRVGVGAYLCAGGVLSALGLLGYALAPSWLILIGAAFTLAVGFSAYNVGLNTFVAAHYTTGQLNWLHAAYGVGLTIGPSLATLLVEELGQTWHLGYLIMFAVNVGVALVLIVTRGRWVGGASGGDSAQPLERASYAESIHVPAVVFGMLLFFVLNGVVAGTGQLSNTLLTSRGILQAGFWVSIYWASFTVGRIIMGFIADRLDKNRLIRAAILCAAFGAVLLWQNASSLLNLVGLAFMGLGCAPLYPTMIARTREMVSTRHLANAIGFQITAAGIGTSLIPGIIAWVAEHTSLSIIGIFPLIGLLIALGIHRYATKRHERVMVGIAGD